MHSKVKSWIKLILVTVSLLLLIVAAANPQVGTRLEEVKQTGIDVFILLDVSLSMSAEDIKPNRLEKAKYQISNLINKLRGDRIGLIIFSGDAYVQIPLTTDYSAASLFLSAVDFKSVPQPGTAIATAINLAAKSFDYKAGTQKVIIVITDGEDHEGNITENIIESKPTKLEEIKKASESLRYSESLRVFSNIKQRIINKTQISYTKNNELLARAEESHSTILQQLIDIFRNKGYSTRSNKFVDLFAHNDKQAYLFEVKSTTNNNFRSQARKGIVQLYEYDYFEIKRYVEETQLKFQNSYRILVPSTIPQDKNYINFINYLDIGLAVVKDQGIKSVGIDSGFSKI